MQPLWQALDAVPLQAVEIVADRVEGILARDLIDRLVRGFFAEPGEAEPLQMHLHRRDIGIGHRSQLEMRIVTE